MDPSSGEKDRTDDPLSPSQTSIPSISSQEEIITLQKAASATGRRSGRHGGQCRGVLAAQLLALLADAGDVCPAGGVPHGDVLLHAGREAGLLTGGER